MPGRPFKPCTHPGCGKLVDDGSSRCPAHKVKAWAKGPDAPKRITGRRLQRMRADLFARSPLCVLCEARGVVRLATIRDHRIPLAEGGRDDESNVQAVCGPCNETKRAEEARRGAERARGGAAR